MKAIKIMICIVVGLLFNGGVFASSYSCAGISDPDYEKPICEVVRQLQELNSKMDGINQKLEDIKSKQDEKSL